MTGTQLATCSRCDRTVLTAGDPNPYHELAVCGTDRGCDRYPHTPDRDDPALTHCDHCGCVIGNPSGGACTIIGVLDDPGGPFGHEPADRNCQALDRRCRQGCGDTCGWNGTAA